MLINSMTKQFATLNDLSIVKCFGVLTGTSVTKVENISEKLKSCLIIQS